METLKRKQTLKSGLVNFIKETADESSVYSVQTDLNKGYWIYKGVIYDNTIFNLKSAKKIKTSQLSKDTVYYITTIDKTRENLFNI